MTCVPSDAPDDYMCLEELKRKPAFRQKFNITDEKVMPYNIIPIIHVPSVGNTAAATVCNELKIKSPNDRELLDAAKETVYQKGFYEGTMLVGEFKGRYVVNCLFIPRFVNRRVVNCGESIYGIQTFCKLSFHFIRRFVHRRVVNCRACVYKL